MRTKLMKKIIEQGILDPKVKYAPIVSLEEFFEENSDESSIGCNLLEHPGIDTFYKVLHGIRSKPDVQDVFVEITDYEEDEEYWPFSERVYILTSAALEEVEGWTVPLEPDEVDEGYAFEKNPSAPELLKGHHVISIWWD